MFCNQVMSDIRLQSWALAISNEGGLTGFPRNIHTRKLLARFRVFFGDELEIWWSNYVQIW